VTSANRARRRPSSVVSASRDIADPDPPPAPPTQSKSQVVFARNPERQSFGPRTISPRRPANADSWSRRSPELEDQFVTVNWRAGENALQLTW